MDVFKLLSTNNYMSDTTLHSQLIEQLDELAKTSNIVDLGHCPKSRVRLEGGKLFISADGSMEGTNAQTLMYKVTSHDPAKTAALIGGMMNILRPVSEYEGFFLFFAEGAGLIDITLPDRERLEEPGERKPGEAHGMFCLNDQYMKVVSSQGDNTGSMEKLDGAVEVLGWNSILIHGCQSKFPKIFNSLMKERLEVVQKNMGLPLSYLGCRSHKEGFTFGFGVENDPETFFVFSMILKNC